MTAPVDREAAALKAILDALLPQLESGLLFYAVWTHRVVSADGSGPVTITCVPDDKRLPNESKIVLRPGADGGYSTPAPGSEIAVGFLNGDPSRPYVHSLDPTATSTASYQPAVTLVELGNHLARTLAHSLETAASFAALSTNVSTGNTISATVWASVSANISALSTYATAIQGVADPLNTATPALTAACGAAVAAISAYLTSLASASGTATAAIAAAAPTLPTVIVKGT